MPGLKRIYSKITEELKQQIKENGEHKWVWTSEKFNSYQQENKNKPDFQANVVLLRECEICCRVFTKQKWADHAYFETHRRQGKTKLMRLEDGKYHCPIPTCTWPGNNDHKITKAHIVYDHDQKDFDEQGWKQEVNFYS